MSIKEQKKQTVVKIPVDLSKAAQKYKGQAKPGKTTSNSPSPSSKSPQLRGLIPTLPKSTKYHNVKSKVTLKQKPFTFTTPSSDKERTLSPELHTPSSLHTQQLLLQLEDLQLLQKIFSSILLPHQTSIGFHQGIVPLCNSFPTLHQQLYLQLITQLYYRRSHIHFQDFIELVYEMDLLAKFKMIFVE